MADCKQEIFTFRGATSAQVDDLCDLWRESLIDCDKQHGTVRVRSDALAIDQFLLGYSLYSFVQEELNNSVESDPLTSTAEPILKH